MDLLSLSQPERDVMLQLVQSRVVSSAVTLAADLWRIGDDWLAEDLYPLITYLLDSLSSRGLVRFKVLTSGGYSRRDEAVLPRLTDVPYEIRLTPEGWALMGYAHKTVEVHRGRHEREVRPDDSTNYLNYKYRAQGGPIEVEDFATHRAHFPQHIHMYEDDMATTTPDRTSRALADPTILQDPNGTGARGYIRVTPEMEARVLAIRTVRPTVSVEDIADEVELPKRTVQYILTDLPLLRRSGKQDASKSLRDRIYWLVQDFDNPDSRGRGLHDAPEIRRVLGMADTEHDIVHILYGLRQQGRIAFDEKGSGPNKVPVNIRMPKKGGNNTQHEEKSVTAPAAEPEATAEEVIQTPSAPGPEAEGYPLLDALIVRERQREGSDAKAMAYITAANAIERIDPDMARDLMDKANALDITFPSPIEREFLRYVESHPEETK